MNIHEYKWAPNISTVPQFVAVWFPLIYDFSALAVQKLFLGSIENKQLHKMVNGTWFWLPNIFSIVFFWSKQKLLSLLHGI